MLGILDHNGRAPTEMLVMPQVFVSEPNLRLGEVWKLAGKQPSTHPITSPTIPVVHCDRAGGAGRGFACGSGFQS